MEEAENTVKHSISGSPLSFGEERLPTAMTRPGPLARFKGLRPTAGQGPKQRGGGREKGHGGVVVVVVVVVSPAPAHDADEAPGAARISSNMFSWGCRYVVSGILMPSKNTQKFKQNAKLHV